MASFLELFAQYDRLRDEWQKRYSSPSDKRIAQKSAQRKFDAGLKQLLGRDLPKFSKNMSTVERAFKAAASKDEATKIYDAAVAKAAVKYKPGGKNYLKATKTYEKYLNQTLSRFNTTAANTSTQTTSGAITGASGGSNFAESKPPSGASSVTSDNGSSISSGALILGLGLVALWFFRK